MSLVGWSDGAAAESLQRAAQAYCDVIATCGRIDTADFFAAIQRQLAAVHSGMFALPASHALHPDDDVPDPEWNVVSDSAALAPAYSFLVSQLGDHRYYREVFDPWALDEGPAVTGDLADDLWDTYMGLRTGLDLWNRGRREQALWQWRFGFEMHWGEHVTGALRALYMLARRHDRLWGSLPSESI